MAAHQELSLVWQQGAFWVPNQQHQHLLGGVEAVPIVGCDLNDLVPTIFWGGGAIEEARLVGAALGIAEPPRQVWVSLEVGVVGDRDGGWGREGVLRTLQEASVVQGVYKDPAHKWVQGGLLGLGAPQPFQKTPKERDPD